MNSTPPLLPTALTISDACAYTGIGRTKIFELLKSNQLVARKIGARTLILRKDLDAFMDSLAPARAV